MRFFGNYLEYTGESMKNMYLTTVQPMRNFTFHKAKQWIFSSENTSVIGLYREANLFSKDIVR